MDLAAWHAHPLDRDDALARLVQAREQLPRASAPEMEFTLRVQGMIAGFWLDHDSALDYHELLAGARDARERALAELVYGQLLMARRREGAHEHLEAGFRLAANLFAAADYYRVRDRHVLLAHLPSLAACERAQTLDELLREAMIVRALRSATVSTQATAHDPGDTVG